jgi:hypothetical protein
MDFEEQRITPVAVKKTAVFIGCWISHAAVSMATVDVAFIQIEMRLLKTCFDHACGTGTVRLHTTALASIRFELVDVNAAGDALIAVFTMRTVSVAATASITKLNKLTV